MALINNTQGLFVTLPINTKYNPTNPIVEDFPTHYDQNGYGGFMAIDSSISEVNSATSLTGKYELIIPEKRRKLGMLIYDVNPSISSFYQCTDVTACSWEEVNFRFRYFYGPTAPAVSNIQVGEKWFDTIVGSEYTYLPIAEGSSEKAWVDIDHIGEGETFSGYMTVDLANTYYVNIGGDEMTGSLTAHKVFRGSNDINFDEDEFVTKSFVFANFPESSGGVFTAHITGTSARFSGGVTAAKFNATQAITEDTQLATKKYVDDNTIRGVDFYIDGQNQPFSTDADAISISGGSNIDIFWDNNSTPNRYVISSTLEVADQFVNIDGDTMTGTLTGTDASFDLIDIGVLSIGQTAYQGIQNPNVPRIQSQGGVLIGGNTLTKQNWLGNNVYLAPEGYVTIGIPNNVPSGWFEGKTFTDPGGTYPFDLRALNISGGIYANDIVEVNPSVISDPANWHFVVGSLSGDSGIYENGLTLANNFAVSTFESTNKGAVFSIGDLYVGRTGIRENAQLRVHGRALKVTGPADFLDNEYITKEVSIMKPGNDPTSVPLVYSQIHNAGGPSNTSEFLFCSLTKQKMGFDFPVQITVRIAAGVGGGNNASSRWFVKTISGVSASGTLNIKVDRSKMISWANANEDVYTYDQNNNTIWLAGYLQDNPNVGQMWWFLDVRPMPI